MTTPVAALIELVAAEDAYWAVLPTRNWNLHDPVKAKSEQDRIDAASARKRAAWARARELSAPQEAVPAVQMEEASEAELVCAEAYQVVGSLLNDLGKFDTPEAEKILDNLSQARMVHDDVLPWEPYSVAQAAGELPAQVSGLTDEELADLGLRRPTDAADTAEPMLVTELQSIRAGMDAKHRLVDRCQCAGCGTWAPHGHPEAHRHEDDCPEIARVTKERNTRRRLDDLIAQLAAAPSPLSHGLSQEQRSVMQQALDAMEKVSNSRMMVAGTSMDAVLGPTYMLYGIHFNDLWKAIPALRTALQAGGSGRNTGEQHG